MKIRPLLALALAGLLFLPGSASAAPAVSIDTVTLDGSTATVTGTATYEAITTAQSVVTDESLFGEGQVGGSAAGNAAGLDLKDATITPIPNGLRFTWILGSMPEQVPPEGVRYTWAFKIGNNMYQLQAKRTNMASVSTLEDPMGHAAQLAGQKNFFQLRGACVERYFPEPAPTVNGCYHLAWLNGSFDPANKRVTIDMPFETKDSIGRLVAPDFKPGAVLVDNGGTNTAGMVVGASFQAAVSNTTTSQYVNGVASYYIGPHVSLAVGTANADEAALEYKPATLTGNSFSGTVSGLGGTKNHVFARLCNGVECAYSKLRAL